MKNISPADIGTPQAEQNPYLQRATNTSHTPVSIPPTLLQDTAMVTVSPHGHSSPEGSEVNEQPGMAPWAERCVIVCEPVTDKGSGVTKAL